MHVFFGLLAALLPAIATYPYVRDIFRRRTKPHPGSFFIWAVLGAIAFFSQLAAGASWSLLLPAADSVATAIIFILSLHYGSGGFQRRDYLGLAVAALGLMLWYVTRQPLLALLITIGVDGTATVLTVIKTYEAPETETFSSWLLAALGGLAAMLAVGIWSPALLFYPVYILVANGAVNVAIVAGKHRRAA